MRCLSCNAENQPAAKFCVACGTAFQTPCVKCGVKNPSVAKFCQECGTSLEPGSMSQPQVTVPPTGLSRPADQRQSLEPHDVLEGERRTVTAQFADIKDSAELIAHLDPRQERAIFDPALPLTTRIGWLPSIVVVFLASCAMSLGSMSFFFSLAGRGVSIMFGNPGLLVPFVLGGGLSAVVSLAILLPLRRRGPELFWVGGIAVAVLVVPPLSMAFRGFLMYAEGNAQLARLILTPILTSNARQWFYPLLHFPANLVLAVRSAVLLALVAWFWSAARSDSGYHLRGSRQYTVIQ
jgi:ribosomal protein L40E